MANEIQVQGVPENIKIVPYEHHTKYHETDQQGIKIGRASCRERV